MNETETLRRFLGSLDVGEPSRHRGLALYPVRCRAPVDLACLTLEEAVARGALQVGEIGEGTVPGLVVDNRTDRRVFLLDGEELRGAKQNRILNTSVVVERASRLAVPVSCVEHGRWRFTAGRTMRPGSVAHPGLRRDKQRQVHASLRRDLGYAADQAEVWRHVDRKLSSLGARSDSDALADGVELHRASLDDYAARLECPAGAAGVVAAIGGRLACADLFADPSLLPRLWRRLVAGYALDAVDAAGGEAAPPPAAEAARLLSRALDAPFEPFAAPGLGASVRFAGRAAAGSALVVDGAVVHVEVFPVLCAE